MKSLEGKEIVKKGKGQPRLIVNENDEIPNSYTASENITETSPQVEVRGKTQEKEESISFNSSQSTPRRITYPDLSTSTVSLGNVSLSNLTLNLVGSAIAKLLSNLNNSPTVCETMACNSQESILLTDDSLATDKSEEFHSCETLPPPKMILEEFVYWMQSMDGGSHTRDISMKAKHVINNILLEIDMEDIMEPN